MRMAKKPQTWMTTINPSIKGNLFAKKVLNEMATMATAMMRSPVPSLEDVARVVEDHYARNLDRDEVSATGDTDLPSEHTKPA